MSRKVNDHAIRAVIAVAYLLSGFLIFSVVLPGKPMTDRLLLLLVAMFLVVVAWFVQERHTEDSHTRGMNTLTPENSHSLTGGMTVWATPDDRS